MEQRSYYDVYYKEIEIHYKSFIYVFKPDRVRRYKINSKALWSWKDGGNPPYSPLLLMIITGSEKL